MAKKWPFDVPQWFKDGFALYRGMWSSGDLSSSEMREHLADDMLTRLERGEPFGRAVWIDFIGKYGDDVRKTQADAAAEERAFAEASGLLQRELFPREVLENLGLPLTVDLGWDKRSLTADLDWDGFEKAITETERKEKSWKTSLGKQKAALQRGQALVPKDNSKTLRQVVADPGDYGFGAAEQ